MATPTALVVAGPAAVVAAMTVATRLRILIKSADFLERASDVDTLILDKTGTVTVGAPTVTQIQPADGRIRGDAARRGGSVRLRLPASGLARRRGRGSGARNREHASQDLKRGRASA